MQQLRQRMVHDLMLDSQTNGFDMRYAIMGYLSTLFARPASAKSSMTSSRAR
jgi:hypothetical protein